jgi:hypothetical protein
MFLESYEAYKGNALHLLCDLVALISIYLFAKEDMFMYSGNLRCWTFFCRLVQTLRKRRASVSRSSGAPVLDKEDGLVLSPHVAATSSRLHECVSGALSRLGVAHVNEREVSQQLGLP